MRGFLTDLLLFALMAMLIYCAVILGAGAISPYSQHRNIKFAKGAYGHLYSRTREIPAHADVDILFLGSSHAYRGFDPRLFSSRGLRTFNLGSSSQSPLQTRLLVDRYLEHLNPKLVVMEVFPLTFTTEGVESALDLIANDTIRWDMVDMSLRVKNIGVINSLLHGTFRQTLGLDAGLVEPRMKKNDTYVSGGYVQRGPMPFKPSKDQAVFKWDPPAYQWEAFEAIIDDLKTRQVPVVLVQTPVTSKYRYNAAERDTLARRFGRYAPYVDLSALFAEDDSTLFYDGHHMRQKGVELFNEAFLDTLEQRGLLPLAERR
jgi:hypothetical protein